MTWLIHQLAAGNAFLVSGLVLLATLPLLLLIRAWVLRTMVLAVIALSVLMISLSSIPLPHWAYVGWMLLVGTAAVAGLRRKTPRSWTITAIVLAQVVGLLSISWELAWRSWSNPPAVVASRMYVIGDSLSAGMGTENGQTWPRLIAGAHGIELIDLSSAGATTGSIIEHIGETQFADGLVVLEIGGNDMFGRLDPAAFERDLEALVQRVKGAGRQLVMFELPLYPWTGGYGRVQRRVAKTHGITLIPRRVLAQIITTPGNTVEDGLHLSIPGQRFMAELVWRLIGPSFAVRTPSTVPAQP